MNKKHKIFISYSHKDEKAKDLLNSHLTSLIRNKNIDPWNDRQIMPGQEWDKVIQKELNEADIILLLISPSFMESGYINGVEVKRALERHYVNDAVVIPIILTSCLWQNDSFSVLHALPKDGLPIDKWENINEAFLDVIKGVQKIIEREDKKYDIINHAPINLESTKEKLNKFSYESMEHIIGLEDFVEFLRDSKYHPKNILSSVMTNFFFLGHGASKWTSEKKLLDSAIERVLVNGGKVRIMMFDPRKAPHDFQQKIILKSIFILKKLMKKYNLRNADFMKVKVYTDYPSFRLAFINRKTVLVGHYRTYTSNSNESPILIFKSDKEWSFYSAFQTLFDDKWERGIDIDEINTELLELNNLLNEEK